MLHMALYVNDIIHSLSLTIVLFFFWLMILRKPKESTHDTLLMKQKLNFLEFTRRIKLESTRRKFDKTSVFIDNSL